jgi:deoxyribonuclease V
MNRKSLVAEFLTICEYKNYRAAINFQDEINNYIPGKAGETKFGNICGLDISFDKGSNKVYAAASVHSFPYLDIIEQRGIVSKTEFPYIPGLLENRISIYPWFADIPGGAGHY